MSNTDNFIDEVTEEMRRERLFKVVKRYGWIGILAVLAIVGGSAYNEWQKSEREAQAQAFGDATLSAMEIEDPLARQQALAAIEAEGDRAVLLGLLAAGEGLAADGEARAAGLAKLRAIAGDAGLSVVWRDLAQLRLAAVTGGFEAPQDRAAALAGLAEAGRPYRPLAQEVIALDHVAAGEVDQALALFEALSNDQNAPSALRARAGQMMVILGGDVAQ